MSIKKLRIPKKSAKTVKLDDEIEKNKVSGTDYQAYIRTCIKKGKLL